MYPPEAEPVPEPAPIDKLPPVKSVPKNASGPLSIDPVGVVVESPPPMTVDPSYAIEKYSLLFTENLCW